MDGLILVNKPQGLTSHDVVVKIRKIHHIKKVGHHGTLDPLATGLIVIAVGKATRLFPFFSKEDKVYCGEIKFGFATDTYDSTGKPTTPAQTTFPKKDIVIRAMKKFEGEILQTPPPYSAKKFRGKPLYELARKNKEFELRPSHVYIHYFLMTRYNPPSLEFKVRCSSGTYIRSLAHEMGQILSCGAHLSKLTRIQIGNFLLKDSFTLEEIQILQQKNRTENYLLPLESLLPDLPKIILNEKGTALVQNGNNIFAGDIIKIIVDPSINTALSEQKGLSFRMFSLDGKFVALAKKVVDKNCFHPFLVIDPRN